MASGRLGLQVALPSACAALLPWNTRLSRNGTARAPGASQEGRLRVSPVGRHIGNACALEYRPLRAVRCDALSDAIASKFLSIVAETLVGKIVEPDKDRTAVHEVVSELRSLKQSQENTTSELRGLRQSQEKSTALTIEMMSRALSELKQSLAAGQSQGLLSQPAVLLLAAISTAYILIERITLVSSQTRKLDQELDSIRARFKAVLTLPEFDTFLKTMEAGRGPSTVTDSQTYRLLEALDMLLRDVDAFMEKLNDSIDRTKTASLILEGSAFVALVLALICFAVGEHEEIKDCKCRCVHSAAEGAKLAAIPFVVSVLSGGAGCGYVRPAAMHQSAMNEETKQLRSELLHYLTQAQIKVPRLRL